jgi:hypothetical protein
MKVNPYIFPALLAFGAVALFLYEYPNIAGCGSELEVNGEMPKERSPLYTNESISQWGPMTETWSDPIPPTFNVNLHGPQNFKFRYSDNVTNVRLRMGSEMLYEGAPIKAYNATNSPKGPLSIEFKWTGDKVNIQVTDACSILSKISW